MVCCYGASMAGPYHIDNELPCQDAFHHNRINKNCVIAAVCDGLGSESKSDRGSLIVSHKTVEYCSKHYKRGMSFSEVKKIMNNSFVYAYKAVLEEAANEHESSDEYDTTVCLAIYDQGHVFYGQSGDSGMVALMHDGHYLPITDQQRDEDGYVFPLCSGPEKWVFGEISGDVAAVMLMTDGVWDQICPRALKEQEIKINIPLTRKFMDRTEDNDADIACLQDSVYKYLENYPRRLLDDDKTVVVIYDSKKPAKTLEEDYYKAPNWEQLRIKAEENLYRKSNEESVIVTSVSNIEEPHLENANAEGTITPIIVAVPTKSIQTEEDDEPKDSEPKQTDITHEDGETSKLNDTLIASGKKKRKNTRHERNKKSVTKKDSKNRRNKLKRIPDIIAIFILLGFSLFAFLMNGFVREHTTVSLLGVFLVCFVANSTVFLPAPSILIVLEYSMLINPIAVAICGAVGASLGEMIGYLTGLKGRRIMKSKIIKNLEEKFPKHPCIYVFVFSALPIPCFDIIGILSGLAKVNIMKFYASCVSGKLVKMLMFVAIGKFVAQIIL